MNPLLNWLSEIFNLHADIASISTIAERIENSALIKGTNMSVLILAMFIASIGLNMNSTAVIIGAMLISPLMGGIMAIGYGLATYDIAYVRKSFIRLLFQVSFCILTSTIYFYLSPISTASSELLARTEPTIWDVLIAFFGGLAGIIGLTREERGNVIPGVAIATALMPPLCTAGYGIAIHSLKFFSGALYLFFINGFFICLSTFILLKFIHIPAKQYVSSTILHRQKIYLVIIGFITILPSMYTAYQSVQNNIIQEQAKSYINTYINIDDTRQVISFQFNAETSALDIALLGMPFSKEEVSALQNHLQEYNHLNHLSLNIIQDTSEKFSKKELEELLAKQKENTTSVLSSINSNEEILKLKKLNNLYYPAFQRLEKNDSLESTLKEKLTIFFPNITQIDIAPFTNINDKGKLNNLHFMVITYVKTPISGREAMQIKQFLEKELSEPVILNIQIATNTTNRTDIISGNGINW